MVRPDGDLHSFVVGEALEGIAELESTLLRLEKTPDDHEALAIVARIVGDLKGHSAVMRSAQMVSFTRAIEDLLDRLCRGVRPVTPLVVDALLASADVLRRVVSQLYADPDASGPADESAERVRDLIASFVEDSRETRPVLGELLARRSRSG